MILGGGRLKKIKILACAALAFKCGSNPVAMIPDIGKTSAIFLVQLQRTLTISAAFTSSLSQWKPLQLKNERINILSYFHLL